MWRLSREGGVGGGNGLGEGEECGLGVAFLFVRLWL